jgi:MarR family transcriptional regulator, lower aerobic nicotinate degradation pathway regulator
MAAPVVIGGTNDIRMVGRPNEALEWNPVNAPFSEMEEMPSWLISRLYAHSHRLLADGFASAGFRGYHFRLLASLQEFGPASQADLGRRTGIDRSDVVAALNELEDRGLIERSADPDDRRRNVITITAAGRKELRALRKVLAGIQEKLLAPLSAADQATFKRLMARVLDDDSRATTR